MATIPINLTLSNGMITVEEGQEVVTIAPGDSVAWIFIGLPANRLAFIKFATGDNELLGPFQSLESSSRGVVAAGNSGSTGSYEYVAMVLDGEEATSVSTTLAIINASDEPNTSPHALVTVDLNANLEEVVVVPHALQIGQGGTAVWHVSLANLPGHFVTFHFEGFSADPMIGPFQAFSLTPVAGGLVAMGEGFSGSSQVHYSVKVRDGAGSVVGSSGDPVIDPLGSPPWAR